MSQPLGSLASRAAPQLSIWRVRGTSARSGVTAPGVAHGTGAPQPAAGLSRCQERLVPVQHRGMAQSRRNPVGVESRVEKPNPCAPYSTQPPRDPSTNIVNLSSREARPTRNVAVRAVLGAMLLPFAPGVTFVERNGKDGHRLRGASDQCFPEMKRTPGAGRTLPVATSPFGPCCAARISAVRPSAIATAITSLRVVPALARRT